MPPTLLSQSSTPAPPGSIDIVRCADRFQSIQPFASLDLRPSVIDLAADPTRTGSVYAMAHASGSEAMSIVRLWVDPTDPGAR